MRHVLVRDRSSSTSKKMPFVGALSVAAAIVASVALAPPAVAVPASPTVAWLHQPNGESFLARQFGDEWYNGVETAAGYTVVKGVDGTWVYVLRGRAGHLRSSNARAEGRPPEGVPKHLRRLDAASPAAMPNAAGMSDAPPPTGPSLAAGPNIGTQRTLVILVDFLDQPSFGTTAAQWSSKFFGATRSVAHYYNEVSRGSLALPPATESHGTANDGVVGWLHLNRNHPNTGADTNEANRLLTRDTVVAANPYVNFASYDTNGNGFISTKELHVTVIVAGQEAGITGCTGKSIWGHQWALFDGDPLPVVDGVTVGAWAADGGYTQFAEMHCTHMATIGVMVHEIGHDLGLPDLYDITPTNNADSNGVGEWSIMGQGVWLELPGEEDGALPAHPDAWSKWYEGWITPQRVAGTGVSIPQVETTGTAYQFLANPNGVDWTWQGTGTGEYFLVENRQKVGYDAALPGCGVLIWHVDEDRATNEDETNKLIDVEEADGLNHLDTKTNRGDAGDPYPGTSGNRTFNAASNPNSNLYGGAASGIAVTNISTTCAATMTADLTDPGAGTAAPPHDGFGAARNALPLPFGENVPTGSATVEAQEPAPSCAPIGKTVWYRVAPSVAMQVTADTTGSNFDTVLAVYRGTTIGGLIAVPNGCSDDIGAAEGPSRVQVNLAAGETYYIQVGGWRNTGTGASASGQLRVDLTAAPPPNDAFATAKAVTTLPFAETIATDGATTDAGEPTPSCAPAAKTVWYRFTPATSMRFVADTTGSSFDTVLAVYTGTTLGGLTPVPNGCSDDAAAVGGPSRVDVDLAAAQTYYVQVGGYRETSGAVARGALTISLTPAQTCDGKTATIVGTPGDDALAGTAGNDVILGLAGNDEIDGATGNDTVCAGSGDDLVHGAAGADDLDGEAGDDAVDMSDATGSVTIDLAGGTATTGLESDSLANVESAFGSASADLLIGTAGPNVLLAGPGNDIVRPLGGADEVDGETGVDTISFSQSAAGVTVDLAAGTASGEGADVFVGVEGAIGSPQADTLLGTAGANQLAGREGNDTLRPLGGNDDVHGGDGADTISFAAAAGPVSVDLDAGTAFGEGSDIVAEVENVIGSALGDELFGSMGSNALTGGSGDDVIWPFGGTDVVNGGAGDDTTSFSQSASPVTVNLAMGVADGEGHDDIALVESVFGSEGDDVIVGNDGVNRLVGGDGDDVLAPAGGADLVVGLAGSDTVSTADAPGGVTLDLVAQTVTGDGTDTLETTENAIGSSFADILVSGATGAALMGGAGDDAFHPGSGGDDLDGGPGRDLVSYVDALAPVNVDLAAGSASGDGNDALAAIEDVLGSSFDDTLVGDELANLLNGRGGDDTLVPGGGNDTANGSDGVDEVSFAGAPTGVTAKLPAGTAAGEGADVLAGVEDLTGSEFADSLTGGSAANLLLGGGGDDTLIPAGGDDVVNGGDGADTVSFVGAPAGVRVDLAAGTSSGEGADQLSEVERAHGSPFADTLLGDEFANRLEGDAGNDTLDGRFGADVLSGGKGRDRASYTNRTERIRVDLDGAADDGTDGNHDGRAEEKDNVKTDVEEVLGGIAGDTLYGGGAANVLRGLGGNDRLFGLAGNDSVYGGGGNDALNGGAGRDLCRQDAGSGKRVGCER